ncbi:MAG: HEAT repeat domain-containing protein [Elusimicrobiota bacterium]
MKRIIAGLGAVSISASLLCAAVPSAVSDNAFVGTVSGVSAQVKAGAETFAKSMDESELLDLLDDQDPEVRKAALVNARHEMGIHTRVREKVMDMAEDTREDVQVRREACRTLHFITNMPEAREALLDLAKGDREMPVRVMATKALYHASLGDTDIRRELLSAAERGEPEIRKAALWALFDSNSDSDVTRFLQGVVSSRSEDTDIRLEALKSLYLGMNRSEVKDMMKDLAKSRGEDQALRVGAISALHAGKGDSDVQRLLEDLSKSSDREIKLAAVRALGDDPNFFLAYFHLGRRTGNHGYISPIVDE